MAKYTIITTEVTAFSDKYCVAGWSPERGAMVRPEPPGTIAGSVGARFWPPDYVGDGRVFDVGSRVTFEAEGAAADFPYPHATEDVVLLPDSAISSVKRMTLQATAAAVAGSVSATIQDAFDGGLHVTNSGLLYVPSGFVGRSLGAIEIDGGVTFWEKTFTGKAKKLRARVELGGTSYDIPVTSDAWNVAWRTQGLDAVQGKADTAARTHIRLGLARPFSARPDECFVQMNDLYFL